MEFVHRSTSGPSQVSTFDLVIEGERVGHIQVRHRPSHAPEVPASCASHIYYEVSERERGKGYGKKLLALGKEKAKEIGLTELIVTCMENNIASRRIIEANGGVLDGSCALSEGARMLRYRIPV